MDFPSLSIISKYTESEYEKEFLEFEFKPGLEYYLRRLDRLMFSGQSALDAGCGAGQWTIALSQRYSDVHAIDLKNDRLTILEKIKDKMNIRNISVKEGSIEILPYDDNQFDLVFCYSVIMFTNIEKTLKEFFRVLKPGGRIYVCLNGDGWSKYLINERGADNENVRNAGRSTLYNTYWSRAIGEGIINDLRQEFELYSYIINQAGKQVADMLTDTMCLKLALSRESGRKMIGYITQYCYDNYKNTLVNDIKAVLLGGSIPPSCGVTRAYSAEEFGKEAEEAGFTNFQWSGESGLVCDWTQPQIDSKFAGFYQNELAVWECIFSKPDKSFNFESPIKFIQSLVPIRTESVYLEDCAVPVLSNGSFYSYPSYLLEHNKKLSIRLGQEEFLRALSKELVTGCESEEEAYVSILSFVQRSIFRDPVAQPLNPDGSLPDSLTILISGRGRCGHVSKVLEDLFKYAGMDAKITYLGKHIITEVIVDGRWVIADADAFKNGIIPRNSSGKPISMEDIAENPYQLDKYRATGWFIRPATSYTKGILGNEVKGYVDALEPKERGFVSGYYSEKAVGYPPEIPDIIEFGIFTKGIIRLKRLCLKWSDSSVKDGSVKGYSVRIGTTSRNWTYKHLSINDDMLNSTSDDVFTVFTNKTHVELDIPENVSKVFAEVTAISNRIEKEPDTFFWPSEEASYVIEKNY
ncbi:MAG: methyltransferase domain-containing protein [Bacillota bacterium]|nr:methyltransferase domain-containing protein [Bacillota bacterium]